jgi:hypothetical protein
MKPKHHSYFCVDVPDLNDIILFLLNQNRVDLLEDTTWLNLALANHAYWDMLLLCKQLRKIDFSPLHLPRLDYIVQGHISTERVDLASACLLHYSMLV